MQIQSCLTGITRSTVKEYYDTHHPAELVTMFHGQNTVDHVWNMVDTVFWPCYFDLVLTVFWPCSEWTVFHIWNMVNSGLSLLSDFFMLTLFWRCSDHVLTVFWPWSLLTIFHVWYFKVTNKKEIYKGTLNWFFIFIDNNLIIWHSCGYLLIIVCQSPLLWNWSQSKTYMTTVFFNNG